MDSFRIIRIIGEVWRKVDFKISHFKFLINTEGIIISININIEKNLTNLIERNCLKIIQQLLYMLQNSTLHNCKSRNISVIFIISISKRISRKKKINKYPQKKKGWSIRFGFYRTSGATWEANFDTRSGRVSTGCCRDSLGEVTE